MALSLAVTAIAGVFAMGIRKSFDPYSGPLMLIFGFESDLRSSVAWSSLWGTLAGGVVLGVAQTVGAQINLGWPNNAGHIAFFVVLLERPQALFPKVYR